MRPARRSSDPPRSPLAPDPTRHRLTAREQEIARLVGDGLRDDAIAGRLGLSPKSVALNIRRVRLRLALASRGDLVRWVNARRAPDEPGTRLRRIADDVTG